MFRTVIALILSVFCFAAVAAKAEPVDGTNPYEMIQVVADKTFKRFHADKALIDADANHLKVIVREELMPYIDYRYASYKVLGQYLRDTSEDERNRFVDAFEAYLVTTYAQAFTEYTNQTVEYAPGAKFTDEKIVDVNVRIIENGRPPIKLLFKARRLKDDTWKAFDLVAEGVSLLQSKQSEITGLIRQKGIEHVITMLNDKANTPVSRATKAAAN
ncbi:MlaC/ttg2D family ABC transporter substrate-binding protein [Shewanella khirikhana]|uniref:Phospholipid-binding protein MlaC n=1 Tax=Shewanella khirikhana TaxID=1965282 RepID=A0ABM7DQU2_9GAMM|nr:ABC transporter substrate-binding protein [Shewanella khirikhana]AZQ12063.1 putative phospholipid-binding protein MlaC precursor [Shewanella khirikhana]